MEILNIKDLSFTYPGCDIAAVKNFSMTVNEGDFILLCGCSGCGKSTLLKLIKRGIAPHGERSGEIFYMNRPQSSLDESTSASDIGFVMQNPEAQIVTDKVWHELAFGAESLGLDNDTIRLRVGEMANYFGINNMFREQTAILSGGQKQLLNLASVMVLSPKLLLLDEPTSQLDPIAAANFINTLYKINRELGVTVLIAEHRLEELFPIADKVAVMEDGRLAAFDDPRSVCDGFAGHPIFEGFPTSVRIFYRTGKKGVCPLTVREGKRYISSFEKRTLPLCSSFEEGEAALSLNEVYFRYERNLPDILRGTKLKVSRGEILSVLGANGSGKSTLLNVLCGIEKPYRGKIEILGKNIKNYRQDELHRHKIALLPQNVQTVFLQKTLQEDFTDMCRVMGYSKKDTDEKIRELCKRLDIDMLLDRHPYDLSGGEGQKAALAKILLTEPEILLLDEPTKGIDAYAKAVLKQILNDLKDRGVTLLIVTHDVEFAANVSDRCALFFDGEIYSPLPAQKFFGSNSFYTTCTSRICRGVIDNAVTVEQAVEFIYEK